MNCSHGKNDLPNGPAAWDAVTSSGTAGRVIHLGHRIGFPFTILLIFTGAAALPVSLQTTGWNEIRSRCLSRLLSRPLSYDSGPGDILFAGGTIAIDDG